MSDMSDMLEEHLNFLEDDRQSSWLAEFSERAQAGEASDSDCQSFRKAALAFIRNDLEECAIQNRAALFSVLLYSGQLFDSLEIREALFRTISDKLERPFSDLTIEISSMLLRSSSVPSKRLSDNLLRAGIRREFQEQRDWRLIALLASMLAIGTEQYSGNDLISDLSLLSGDADFHRRVTERDALWRRAQMGFNSQVILKLVQNQSSESPGDHSKVSIDEFASIASRINRQFIKPSLGAPL